MMIMIHRLITHNGEILTSKYMHDLIKFTVILIIAYIYCLNFAPSIEKIDTGIFGQIDKLHKKCFLKCGTIFSSNETCKNI